MNQHGMQQMSNVPGGMGISPMMQQPSPQQAQPQQQQQSSAGPQTSQPTPPQQSAMPNPPNAPVQQQSTERLDNITKVKGLAGPLRESLAITLKMAAQSLQHNNHTDNGTMKGVDNNPTPRFDKHLEEFYSICDQIELHMKTSIQCMQQSSSSQRYLPVHVASTRMEPLPMNVNDGPIAYPQYLSTVRTQIGYAKDIHDTLICAAQNISLSE